MVFGDGTFRSRAASLLRPSTPSTNQFSDASREKGQKGPSEPPLNEKCSQDTGQTELDQTQTTSSGGKTYHSSGPNAIAHDRDAQRIVRTIPAWVHTLDEDDEDLIAAAQSLPLVPAEIQIAQHNSSPAAKHIFRPNHPRGRLYDRQRDSTPLIPSRTTAETGSRWKAFADASAYPARPVESGEIVSEEWLVQNGADYSRPWLAGDDENGDPEKDPMHMFRAKRRAWYIRAQRTVLRNPIVPMVIRMNVWCFSAVALGLAASIHHLTDTDRGVNPTPSTDMAIIVDVVAMVYLLYITYDEYSGKPLGLRPARAKMRLIFLDLFFIVFDSANLSLAFVAIRSESCNPDDEINDLRYTSLTQQICRRQKGLASVLLIALIAWLLTFAISVLRLIERVTGS